MWPVVGPRNMLLLAICVAVVCPHYTLPDAKLQASHLSFPREMNLDECSYFCCEIAVGTSSTMRRLFKLVADNITLM